MSGASSPTIPTPSESSSHRFDLFEDPELHFDRLPLPYRMLNDLLWEIFDSAWQLITERQRFLMMDDGLVINVQMTESVLNVPTHLFTVMNQAVAISSANKIMMYGFHQGDHLLNECRCGEQNIRTLDTYSITTSLFLALVIDDLGKVFIIVVKGSNSRVVQNIAPSPDSTQSYVLAGKISPDGHICAFVVQDKEVQNAWIELYTMPLENWIKETDVFAQTTEQPGLQVPNEWSSAMSNEAASNANMVDRLWNEVQLTMPAFYCKVKAPGRLTGSTIKSLSASLRQMPESSTSLLPIQMTMNGLHLFTDAALEYLRREFVRHRNYPHCLLRSSKQESEDRPASTKTDPVENESQLSTATKPSANATEMPAKTKGFSQKQSKRKEHGDGKFTKQNNTKKARSTKSQPATTKHTEEEDDPTSATNLTDSGTTEHGRLDSTSERLPLPEKTNSNAASQGPGDENEIETGISNLLLDFGSLKGSLGYPRYEFIPHHETVEDSQMVKKNPNAALGRIHSMCVYWTHKPCLYFYSMDKPNKNLELILEDVRIFSTTITHIKVFCAANAKDDASRQQGQRQPRSSSSSSSSPSYERGSTTDDCRLNKILLLIGLSNGSVVIRDMETGLYWPTVTTGNAPVCQLGMIRNPFGGYEIMMCSVIQSASNISSASQFRLVTAHLNEDYEVAGQNIKASPLGNRLYPAACIFQTNPDCCVMVALDDQADIHVYLFHRFFANLLGNSTYKYLRIRLPAPYRLVLTSGTAGLLPDCQLDPVVDEFMHQLQVSHTNTDRDPLCLWIRGTLTDRYEESPEPLPRQRLFRLLIEPTEMDQRLFLHPTEALHKEQKPLGLAAFANRVFRKRNLNRLERGKKFEQLLTTLPQKMNQCLCVDH